MTDVRIVEAQTVRGGVVLIALSRSDPGRAYVLESDDHGGPVCPCEGYARHGDCAHVRALFAPQPTLSPKQEPPRQRRVEVALT